MPTARVYLDGDRLVMERLVTGDPAVVAGARRVAPTDLEGWSRSLLGVGARAAAAAGGAVHADALEARIDLLAQQVSQAADSSAAAIAAAVEAAADPNRGSVRLAVEQALGALAADVNRLVVGEDAPVRLAVSRAVTASTSDAAARVERALQANADQIRAALAGPSGPVQVLRAEITTAAEQTRREVTAQLADVRDLLAEARAGRREVARSSHKGQPFEDAVIAACTAIAAGTGQGDAVDCTATTSGAAARKTGDAVWHVARALTGGLPAAVVVEAKSTRMSSQRWRNELDLSRRNRSATAALGVVDGVDLMPNRQRLLVLTPTDLVVAWSPDDGDDTLLAACLLLLRAAAASAAVTGAGRPATNLAAVGDSLRAALDLLAQFDALDRTISQTRKSVEETLHLSSRLRTVLGEHLGRAARLLGDDTVGTSA